MATNSLRKLVPSESLYDQSRRIRHWLVVVLTLAVAGAIANVATTVSAQPNTESAPDLGWLSGNWSITYTDRHLGEVSGYAVVEQITPNMPPVIRYVVTDPRNGRHYSTIATDNQSLTEPNVFMRVFDTKEKA